MATHRPVSHRPYHAEKNDTSEVVVNQVKELLSPEDKQALDDVMIKRFIRATGGDLKLAAKRLHHTLVWRTTAKPEAVVCKACARDPGSHWMHIVGYCNLGRPIIYSCLAMASNRDYHDNSDHMIQTFEMAVKCMPPGQEQWVWVCDFHGFGMQDCNPKLAKAFLGITAEHYPERLGLFVIVDTPMLFSGLWRAIQPFVDPKTKAKIVFVPWDVSKVGTKSHFRAEVSKHFAEETCQWLEAEMTQNREKSLMKEKVFSFPAIHKKALACQEDPASELCGCVLQNHDYCGTKEVMAAYKARPELLEPQALALP